MSVLGDCGVGLATSRLRGARIVMHYDPSMFQALIYVASGLELVLTCIHIMGYGIPLIILSYVDIINYGPAGASSLVASLITRTLLWTQLIHLRMMLLQLLSHDPALDLDISGEGTTPPNDQALDPWTEIKSVFQLKNSIKGSCLVRRNTARQLITRLRFGVHQPPWHPKFKTTRI